MIIFDFSQPIFILLRGEAPGGQRMNNFLPGKTSHAPAVGLSYPDMSLLMGGNPGGSLTKRMSTHDKRQTARS